MEKNGTEKKKKKQVLVTYCESQLLAMPQERIILGFLLKPV